MDPCLVHLCSASKGSVLYDKLAQNDKLAIVRPACLKAQAEQACGRCIHHVQSITGKMVRNSSYDAYL